VSFKHTYILFFFLSAFFLSAGESGYILQSGEELVDGRIFFDKNGDVGTTIFELRKPNAEKDWWSTSVGGPRGGGVQNIKKKEKPDWLTMLYDYYVVVNGEKTGPFDRIITDIDHIMAPDNIHYGYLATLENRFIPVVNGKNQPHYYYQDFYGDYLTMFFSPSGNHYGYLMCYRTASGTSSSAYLDGKKLTGKWGKTTNFKLRISDDGEMMFQDGRGGRSNNYIVTNKEEFAGPFNSAHLYGFGKSEMYALYTDNNKSLKLKIGSSVIDIQGFYNNSKIVDNSKIYVVTKDEAYPKGDRYGVSLFSIDLKTKSKSKLGDYYVTKKKNSVNATSEPKDKAIFILENKRGEPLILDGKGSVLQKGQADYAYVNVLPEMDIAAGEGVFFMSSPRTDQWEKPFTIRTGVASDVRGSSAKKLISKDIINPLFRYNKKSKTLFISGSIIKKGKKKEKEVFLYSGGKTFTLSDETGVYGVSIGSGSDLAFYTRPGMNKIYNIYRNNKRLQTVSYLDSKTFRVSPYNSSYALRYGKDKEVHTANSYLGINGHEVGMFYGQPEWSDKEKAFVSLHGQNGKIELVAFKMAEKGMEQHVITTSSFTSNKTASAENNKTVVKKEPVKQSKVSVNALNLLSAYAKSRYRVSVHSASNPAFAWDVAGWSRENGGNVQLWNTSGQMVQDFYFVKADKGENYYHIQSASSGLYLHISGAKDNSGSSILQWNGSGAPQTTFIAEADNGGRLSFRTLSGYYFDIAGGKVGAGVDIRLWVKNGSMAQKFVLRAEKPSAFSRYIGKNSITIHPMANTRFVLQSKRGENYNGVRFSLEYNRKGMKEHNYRIYAAPPLNGNNDTYFIQNAATGRFLHTEGARFEDGTGVVLWEGCGGQNTRWSFERQSDGSGFIIRSGGNSLLECNGYPPKNMKPGTGVGLFHDEGQADQRWTFRLMD